ncbi:tyrosine--tRNA ligase [Blattabacterium cuenoti]|uniref:tyrosine--tRNA ligase n=1 Tax=Blattabacterium cuenoti TaxID=1653831 RepID=UPI00163C778F|nr:tyrosine--tRNA ligase [Blattabacterium cuenoti]
MKNIIDELIWRGLIQNSVPNLKNILKKPITIYVGFDPTSNSLHIGNLLIIITLIHFKKFGYNTIILIGGATGLIGDPSGKESERKILNKSILKTNIISIKIQIYKLFKSFSEKIELLNNFDWIKQISFIDFIRKVGKYLSVNYLISKDSVKHRMENGISFNEFSYSLIQGYDFYYLNKTKNCKLQIGGSDQWGNITLGIELIRKKTGKKVYGFTIPLIIRNNGIKFGKSNRVEDNIWLDENKTSPYKFYQYFINLSDIEIEKYIKMYSFLSKEKIEYLIAKHKENPEKRLLQKKLSTELTKLVHGDEKYKEILNVVSILFDKNYKNIKFLGKEDYISIYNNIPNNILSKKEFNNGIYLSNLLKKSGLINSNSESIRAIKNNSIYVNKISIKKDILIDERHIIGKKYIILQYGKKNFFILIIK